MAFVAGFVAERSVVVGRVDDGPWSDAPTEARSDQRAELAAVVVGHRGSAHVVLAPDGVTKLRLDGRVVTPEKLGAAKLVWSAVEPHGFRDTKARNGATSEFYSNVSTEPRTFGTWLGYDHIDYFERELAAKTPIITAVIDSPETQLAGLGTLRFDLIRIDYAGDRTHSRRDWDHVIALWEDRSDPDGPDHGRPDGKLDGFDLVIHMGHPRLVIEPLAKQAPATIDVLRWQPQALVRIRSRRRDLAAFALCRRLASWREALTGAFVECARWASS